MSNPNYINRRMHIGQQIKTVFDSLPKSCTVEWLAGELHCDRRNVYRLFKRNNIDVLLLAKLSVVLGHDFFADLSNSYKNETETK